MRHRLAGNRHVERYLARKRGESEALAVATWTAPTAPATAGALIAGEMAKIVVDVCGGQAPFQQPGRVGRARQ